MILKELLNVIYEDEEINVVFNFGILNGTAFAISTVAGDEALGFDVRSIETDRDDGSINIFVDEFTAQPTNEKEKQPKSTGTERLFTLDELNNHYDAENGVCGSFAFLEMRGDPGEVHAAILDRSYPGDRLTATWNASGFDNFYETSYGKDWRCWSDIPTEEKMRNTAWMD